MKRGGESRSEKRRREEVPLGSKRENGKATSVTVDRYLTRF